MTTLATLLGRVMSLEWSVPNLLYQTYTHSHMNSSTPSSSCSKCVQLSFEMVLYCMFDTVVTMMFL